MGQMSTPISRANWEEEEVEVEEVEVEEVEEDEVEVEEEKEVWELIKYI